MTTPSNETLDYKVKSMNDKIDGVKTTLDDFIKEIKKNYVEKLVVKNLEEKICNHQIIINRLAWSFVTGVFGFISFMVYNSFIK